SSSSPSASIGPGGRPGSREDGRGNAAPLPPPTRSSPPGLGLHRLEVGLAEPGRGDRAPPAAVLLPLLPAHDRAAGTFPLAGRGRDALLDPEHRQLVPVRFRRLPDRIAAAGHLRRVARRQGSLPLGPRGAGTRTVHEFRGRRRPPDPFGGRGPRRGLVALRMEGALVYGRPFAMGWIDAAIALPTSLHRAFPPRSYVRAVPSRK